MSSAASENRELADFDEQRAWTEETEHEFQSLPRVDGGKEAWLFLTGCFLLEALVWGQSSTAAAVYTLLTMRRLPFLVRCLSGLLQSNVRT